MKPVQDRIKEIKNNGFQLDFGTVFENAFENYKKIALYAGAMLLVFSILFGILIVGLLFYIFGVEVISDLVQPGKLQEEMSKGTFLLIYTSCIIVITCLLSPFQAGFLKMAECAEKDEEFHVSTIFEYYKLPYIINIFIATFIITTISSSLSFLPQSIGIQVTNFFISLSISLLTFLTIPLIVFGKLNAFEAISSSAAIILKKPILILGLFLMGTMGAITGLIAIGIGIFFTYPFVYSMNYTVYKSIIGIDSTSELSEKA